MKIVVQDRRTNSFLANDAKWIRQLDKARAFNTSLEALRFCTEKDLKDIDVLVCYSGSKNSLRLPLC